MDVLPRVMRHCVMLWGKGGIGDQCHLDKDDAKNSVCRNMYPVLFLYNFINWLTGKNKCAAALTI